MLSKTWIQHFCLILVEIKLVPPGELHLDAPHTVGGEVGVVVVVVAVAAQQSPPLVLGPPRSLRRLLLPPLAGLVLLAAGGVAVHRPLFRFLGKTMLYVTVNNQKCVKEKNVPEE